MIFIGDLGVFGVKIGALGSSNGGNCRKNYTSLQSAENAQSYLLKHTIVLFCQHLKIIFFPQY